MRIDGVELELHGPGDYLSDLIRRTGTWPELAILEELRRRLEGSVGVIVDGGAMIGTYSAYLATHVEHQAIHAFEPLDANLELLWNNVRPFASVWVHPVALSERMGVVRLELDPGNLGHTQVSERGELEVPCIDLDAYRLRDVVLLKLDVEGHEPQALLGAQRTIARCRPLVLLEDWRREYAPLLPGYELAAEWEQAHQTFLYQPA